VAHNEYRFYDANMHGYSWDAARAKYQPLVEYVADKYELLNIVNEMIGELNASHTGAAVGPGAREGAVLTSHVGLDLTPDEKQAAIAWPTSTKMVRATRTG